MEVGYTEIDIVLNTQNRLEFEYKDENGNPITLTASNASFYLRNPENDVSKQYGTTTIDGSKVVVLLSINDNDDLLTFDEYEDIYGNPPPRYAFLLELDGVASIRGKVRIVKAGK